MGFPGDSVVENPPANAGDAGSIPELRRSPGEGNDNQLQYSCLGNPMDRGAWWATVQGVAKKDHNNRLDNLKQLKKFFFAVLQARSLKSMLPQSHTPSEGFGVESLTLLA